LFDPIGWQTWDEISNTGLALLALGFMIWIFLDFLRIARVRRMMKAIEKRDIERMKKIADAGLKTRKWLRLFARKGENESTVAEKSEEIAKNSVQKWGRRILLTRKLSPLGLVASVATSASIELARAGAGKITDAVDERLQKEFDKIAKTNTKTLLWLLFRDLLMGIIPILFLAYLPVLLG
jgi:transposase